jgi:hypothetical protein
MFDADSIRVARPHGEHDPRFRAIAFSRVKPDFRPFAPSMNSGQALSLSKGRCARQGDPHYEQPHYLCFDPSQEGHERNALECDCPVQPCCSSSY